jgi:hypothetical protein
VIVRTLTDHIDCLTAAEGTFRSTLFHLHDGNLWQLLDDLFRNWDNAWYVGRTTHHDHLHRGVATLILSDFDPSDRWKEHDTYLGHVQRAQRAIAGLTEHVHEEYPEFDLAESDREAGRKYWDMVKRVEKQMKEIFERSGARAGQDGEEPVASDEAGGRGREPRENHLRPPKRCLGQPASRPQAGASRQPASWSPHRNRPRLVEKRLFSPSHWRTSQ